MEIAQNIIQLKKEIALAEEAYGRAPGSVKLIAVSKTKPMEMVKAAADCGMVDFGENRPQELAMKGEAFPYLRWHQIGQLQKNKVRQIIDKVTLIHSVDSFSLCEEIEKRASAIDKVQKILVQVNCSGEETKSGVRPADAAELCQRISELPHLQTEGLMTISARGMSEEENYALFCGLRELAENIDAMRIPNCSMKELSMGMTHDYLPAIRAGATMIRVGTGIFGERK